MPILAIVLTVVFGLALLPVDLRLGWGARLSAAFCAGAFAVSVEMFLLDVSGLGWSLPILLAPWALIVALRLRQSNWRLLPQPTLKLEPAHAILLVAAIPVALLLPYERLMPLTLQTWDSWAIWLFKAKAFYADGTVSTYLERSAEFEGQPGYPLLVPLYGAFIYLLNGGVADQVAKLYSPCFYLALIGLFYGFARRLSTVTIASSLTAVLCLVPAVATVAFDLPGYADTALAAYLVAGGGFLYFWLKQGRTEDLWGLSIAATAAAWTKNEGQVFMAMALLVGVAGLLRHKGPTWRWAALLLPAVALMASWSLVRGAYGVEAAGFAPGLSFQLDLFTLSLKTLVARSFNPTLFALAFYMFAAAMLLWKPLKGPLEFWSLPAIVFAQLGAALLAYSTGRNDIDWWLGTSADRILSQVAPLALLPVAVMLGHWSDQTVEAPEPPKRKRRR